MPEIGDVMDVTINDLTPEQQAQLKDAIDQFQTKCLMSFGKNRSGVSYHKAEMPKVLLPREPDTTAFQEKEEALNAFRETAEAVMGKHHTAFLNMFKQMMIGVFGPGMEKVFSQVSPHPSSAEVGETSSSQPTGAQPPLQGLPIQPPPQSFGSRQIQPPVQGFGSQPIQPPVQSFGSQPIQPPVQSLGSQPIQPPIQSMGSQPVRPPLQTIEVNPFNSRTHINLHMGNWRSAHLDCRPIPLTR
jgi:hypothetical protein